ncbi:MAG TPA: DUF1963 domain-containing protein [Longimicrobium sp.]|nr:DUF1963 domain-containing protein [Longimicrobium sp.]
MTAVLAKVKHARRPAYLPLVRDGDGPPGASKFSGVPWLAPGEAWPPCANCGLPMQLFLQLAADELPGPARARIGAGNALQFYFCTNGERGCDSEAWEPFSRSVLIRIVPVQGAAAGGDMPRGMFPPKTITGWEAMDDYPGMEELEELTPGLDDGDLELVSEDYPVAGDKLLGWPLWVQWAEYPECRTCGARMELLFQVESERNVPWIFGDMGIGHVTQCPSHPSELAFQWAST